MKGEISGSIILFVGPPGVGKTSLGRSIAARWAASFSASRWAACATRRKSRATGAPTSAPCRASSSRPSRTRESANPVIMLDEIDKIGASYQGDPASALLEVLDPEQNSEFPRPLPGCALRSVQGAVYLHGQPARHHPGAAAGSHGGDSAVRLPGQRKNGNRQKSPAGRGS